MTTAFSAIQAGIVAALSAAPALAGGYVSYNKTRPVPASQDSAIVVRIESAKALEFVLGAQDWETMFSVECLGRTVGSSDAWTAVDALLNAAWIRISGIDAESIGAQFIGINPAVDWQFDEMDGSMVAAVIRVTAQHRTPTGSLTA